MTTSGSKSARTAAAAALSVLLHVGGAGVLVSYGGPGKATGAPSREVAWTPPAISWLTPPPPEPLPEPRPKAEPKVEAEDKPAPPPEPKPAPPEPLVRPGIDDSPSDAKVWLGMAEESPHEAKRFDNEQAAMTPAPGEQGQPGDAGPMASPEREPAPVEATPQTGPAPTAEPKPDAEPVQTPAPAPTPENAPLPPVPAKVERAPTPEPPPEAAPAQEPRSESTPATEPARRGDDEPRPAPTPSPGAPASPQAEPPPTREEPRPAQAVQPRPIPAPDGAPAALAPPEARPAPAPAGVLRPGVSNPGNLKGELAETESDAGSLKEPIVVKWGKVLAGRGVEIRTSKPRWSTTALVSSNPRDTLVKIVFDRTGKVVKAELMGGGTGYADVDGPLLDAITRRWRATGRRFAELNPADPKATLTLYFMIDFGV